MAMLWRFQCDGSGCKAAETVPPYDRAPAGWLVRTIVDETVSGEEHLSIASGRSTLQSVKHYCPACRRRAAA